MRFIEPRTGWVIVMTGLIALASCTTYDDGSRNSSDALEDDFEWRMARYSQEELVPEKVFSESGTVLVSTKKCKAEDKQRLDALFPISEARKSRSEQVNAPFGLPLSDAANDSEVFLHHDEYILLYNSELKLPVFASYRLRAQDVVKGEREECFREDPRLETAQRSRTIDYQGSTDLDKGHLVPDADMQRSRDAAMNTYFMSNMMPQFGSVNSGSWSYIEAAGRLWAGELGEVYVVSGPIFDKDDDGVRDDDSDANRAPPTKNVAKPTAFYRIVLRVSDDGSLRAISFILPHIQASTAPNPEYVLTKLTSIDAIEQVTGYDLFSSLPDVQEDALEATIEDDFWCRRRCNGSF
tara:strand:- start:1137 stop:2192 length:1056 start_codon:yes stop_codon:yes gene_type:complete